MAKLTESVSAITPLGDALREPAKAPRKRRESTTPEPLGRAWSCPCHEMRFDDLREIYLHIRAELQARADVRDSGGRLRIAKCGTTGGYQAHRRKGEETCDPCRSAQTAYRAANPEKDRARSAAYRAAHPEKVRDQQAAYHARNRAAINAKAAARMAAKRAADPERARASQRARYAARKAAQQRDAA